MTRERRELVKLRERPASICRAPDRTADASRPSVKSRHCARSQAALRSRSMGPSLAAEGAAAQRAAKTFGRVGQLLLQPAAERLVEEPRRRRLGEDLEERIDAGFDRALAQEVRAEAVDGADVRFLEALERLRRGASGARQSALASVRARSSRSRSRSFSSPAAFSVNVTATISPTSARPSASIVTIRPTSSVVLPVPAAASTISVSSRLVAIASRAAASDRARRPRSSWHAPAAPSGRRADRPACARRASLRPGRRPRGSRTRCTPEGRAPAEGSRARWRGRRSRALRGRAAVGVA